MYTYIIPRILKNIYTVHGDFSKLKLDKFEVQQYFGVFIYSLNIFLRNALRQYLI